MRYIGIITLLALCLTLILLTSCNSQSSSTGPLEEPVEDPDTVYPQKWATGDGTAENPWANDCIQKAYDACPAGETIYLKAGYYQLAGELTITKSVHIVGEGMGKTIILTADASGLNTYNAVYVTFKDFTIDGDAQVSEPKKNCFNLIGFDPIFEHYILMENIEAKNALYCGINIYQINHSLFQNIYAHDNGEHGMHIIATEAGFNNHNDYRDIYAWNNGKGGFDDSGNETTPEASYNTYDNINCRDNGEFGIYIGMMSNFTFSNAFASGNGTKEWGACYGIYIDHIEDFDIHDCLVSLSGFDGIYITESENITLTNVISKNNNAQNRDDIFDWLRTCEGGGCGISGITIHNSSGIKFTSCQSYDDRATPLQAYGIELEGTNTEISILNCKLTPNAFAEIYNPAGTVVTVITEKMLAKF